MRRKQSRLSEHGVSGLKGEPLRYPISEEEKSFFKWKKRGFPKRVVKHPEKLSRFGITGLKEQPSRRIPRRAIIEIGRPLDEQKKEFERREKSYEESIQIGIAIPEEEKELEYFGKIMDILGDKKIPWFIRKKKLEEIEEKYAE